MRPVLLWSFCVLIAPSAFGDDGVLDFNRDVRPVLADKCFHCHGPDPNTRKADLRLDQEDAAKASVIVPGHAADSELMRRLLSTDPDEMMPPPDSGRQLKPEQTQLLKRWIEEGAVWARHWAFERPVQATLPKVSDPSWPQNAIDHFVMARLDSEPGDPLKPSPAADKATLARRVSFDLTGLPPTRERVLQFVSGPSPDAYETFVDELLASPQFGERMAMEWLDAARYADSDGYQADATRQNWPWRDWVVDAFNSDMPFDDFTVQQFAGDLLPDAAPEQILATCFHRNHMHNGEGGRDPEESRMEYVMDRVNTIGTVWMGLTLGCAQCHSHKYDPITQTEYYQLNAFFNSIDETGKAGSGAAPFLKFESRNVAAGMQDSIDWLKTMETRRQGIRAAELQHFEDWLNQHRDSMAKAGGHQSWHAAKANDMETTGGTSLRQLDGTYEVSGPDPRHDDYLFTVAPALPRITGIRLTVLPSNANGRLSRFRDGHFILTNLKLRKRSADGTRERDLTVSEAKASYEAVTSGRVYGPVDTVLDDDPRTGWMSTGSSATESKVAAFVLEQPLVLEAGESLVVELRQRSLRGYSNLQRFRLEFTDEAGPAAKALHQTPLERLADATDVSADLRTELEVQFLADRSRMQAAEVAVANAKQRKSQYDAAAKAQDVTVLRQREKPRDTHVLVRGVWNNKGDQVRPGTPAVLSDENADVDDRLKLARWLVSKQNPLTARVVVNRYWQMHFGFGLVRTPDDFGTQGEPPTHPELLDWLAVEFMDSGWNVKHIHRLIVTSATYRQSSIVSESLRLRDPDNRLLARATRFRLPSWMIRDAALATSGLLANRIGGPPVYPFQPEGAWLDATMGRFRYEPSVGSDRYRRSLYTFWRRSVGPTGMFDASKRRSCEVRSVRTNTPLHALNLMNDETFVEAAKMLASTAAKTHETPADQAADIFERVVLRKPTPEEQAVLEHQLQLHQQEYAADVAGAVKLLSVGQTEVPAERPVELAALTMLATSILNLDETITHE
ncbi:MAG: PSD1 and planctomycete cytochrome C domain-containing protein [Planctomycetaceae bacterium]